MSDKYFSDALLHGDSPIDLQAITDRVLRRDRRRMFFLGFLCVIAWMLVVMLPWSTTLPMLAKVMEHQAHLRQDTAFDANPATLPATADHDDTLHLLRIVKGATIATFLSSLASMFFAAVCTVALILLTRRATLRQVNARLADISAQLKLLTKEK
jgi:hypothetical protein